MHELEEDGTDDTDDVEDGNQDKDGPKNLFSHATGNGVWKNVVQFG